VDDDENFGEHFVDVDMMDDEAFARSLQEEEDMWMKKEGNNNINCGICNQGINDIYILDDCAHKFCKICIQNYAMEKVSSSFDVACPFKGCGVPLSVRDTNQFFSKEKMNIIAPKGSSPGATQRITSELINIINSQPEKNGYSIEPIGDNLYAWEVKFFGFDKSDPLAKDMQKLGVDHILIHVTFPSNYPFTPPYIRVIRPRFKYRTGHVTIGGSICMELLTNKGWSPQNTVEAVLVSVRSQLIEGGAMLDMRNKHDYTVEEAKVAFDRLVREHGWY